MRGCGHRIALRGSRPRATQGTRPQDSLKTGDLRGPQAELLFTQRSATKPLLLSERRHFNSKANLLLILISPAVISQFCKSLVQVHVIAKATHPGVCVVLINRDSNIKSLPQQRFIIFINFRHLHLLTTRVLSCVQTLIQVISTIISLLNIL